MTTTCQNRSLKQKNQLTLQQINDQLKALEDQKLQLIQSIFRYSTESPQLTQAKSIPMEIEDQKISEISTALQSDDKQSEALAKESHLYQKMTSLLSNNGSLHALSILCQEELGKLDQMINFPLELKVLNGISKLETLQSLKKQKRKSKRKTHNNGIQRRSRKIKKENTSMPGLKNIIEEAENKMLFNNNDNDLVQSLLQDCEPQFGNENAIFLGNSIEQQQQRKNSFNDDFFQNAKASIEKIDETNLFAENQIQKQLEVVHNPNDSTRDQTKISELHNHISLIEGMLCETKEQLQLILD